MATVTIIEMPLRREKHLEILTLKFPGFKLETKKGKQMVRSNLTQPMTLKREARVCCFFVAA